MSRNLQLGAIVATLVLVFGVWLVTKNAASLQQEIYVKLEKKFSFTSSMVSAQIENQRKEFLKIDPIDNGLIFEAGFRNGDIIISHTKPAFYALLYKKKGKTETIEIFRGNLDSSFNRNSLKKITFEIPN
ncbi:MAG: hypothetical protein EX270_08785 [Pseudomonadales bacterium]|nr:MAG: hypothetical protein EX270_08785 [Pseudomonadales bacterium]